MQLNHLEIMSRRQEYSVSQKTLAQKIGVSVSTVSRLERGENVTFLSVVKIMEALDLTLEDIIIRVSPAADLDILDELDRIREQRLLYSLETTLKKLTLAEWRSKEKLSIYYDWHKAILLQEEKKYAAALKLINSALKRTHNKDSLEYLKVSLYMAKGNILYLSKKNGLSCYIEAGRIYNRYSRKINYKTGVKLYFNIMNGYCRTGNYENINDYAKKAKCLLSKHESTYLLGKITDLEHTAGKYLNGDEVV